MFAGGGPATLQSTIQLPPISQAETSLPPPLLPPPLVMCRAPRPINNAQGTPPPSTPPPPPTIVTVMLLIWPQSSSTRGKVSTPALRKLFLGTEGSLMNSVEPSQPQIWIDTSPAWQAVAGSRGAR